MGRGVALTDQQASHVEVFVRRYTARTRRSREYAAQYRPMLADNRAALGFRMATKALVYPIVGERSAGARLWDLDGNEYIDFTMGFGVHFFGHRPAFIFEAVDEQLRRGAHLGPQSDLAGPAARLLCELTGMERALFCNTGSEAIMTAVRIARAVTKRDRIVIFEGAYHGTFDGVLARRRGGRGDELPARPVAPGTPQRMVDDVVVLPYGTGESLAWLAAHADSLAAVLVEPMPARRLEFHPREFLADLRSLTARTGTVLIFDEMIAGFRLGTRGAQGFYGIDADLATYGKVIGGGFPLGVVAGRAALMDAIDGGPWRFDDDSFPAAEQTFFAGTFCKHPATMAAACAVLRHIQQRGHALFDDINARTARLVEGLRHAIQEAGVPVRVETCGSRFSFRIDPDEPFANLLFYHLLDRGMYVWEGRGCFLSTAHTDADCDRLVEAFRQSLDALRQDGFLPARTFPLTTAQRHVWIHAQLGDDASRAYNEQRVFGLRGPFDINALRAALDDVMRHHEGLRTVCDPSGTVQHVRPSLPIVLRVFDAQDELQARAAAAREVFDLAGGPLVRVHVYRHGPEHHTVQIVHHHLAMDAQGRAIFLRDLESAYRARRAGDTPRLPPAMQLGEYVGRRTAQAAARVDREVAWHRRFEAATPLSLPLDGPRPLLPAGPAGQLSRTCDPALTATLRAFSRRENCTFFTTLFSGVLALLHRLSDQDDIVVGVPSAGRPFPGAESLLAHCVDVLPIRSRVGRDERVRAFVTHVRGWLLDAYEDEIFSAGALTDRAGTSGGPGVPPLVSVTFNLEPPSATGPHSDRFADLILEEVTGRERFAVFDLRIDAVESHDRVELIARFNAALFTRDRIDRMLAQYLRVLEQVAAAPDRRLEALTLLDESEQRQIVGTWNETAAASFETRCLHEMIERQAAHTPDAAAVIVEEQHLTYAALNGRANQLARILARQGVGPEVRVGLCVERRPEMVIAILAVLKAGGAYVPLDPRAPSERLAFMLGGVDARAVLVHAATRARVPTLPGVAVISVDDSALIAGQSADNVASGVTPANLAYVIHTSGSTGTPKAVAIMHRSAVALVAWAAGLSR